MSAKVSSDVLFGTADLRMNLIGPSFRGSVYSPIDRLGLLHHPSPNEPSTTSNRATDHDDTIGADEIAIRYSSALLPAYIHIRTYVPRNVALRCAILQYPPSPQQPPNLAHSNTNADSEQARNTNQATTCFTRKIQFNVKVVVKTKKQWMYRYVNLIVVHYVNVQMNILHHP